MQRISILFGTLLAACFMSAALASGPEQECISDRPFMVVSNQQLWGVLGFNVATHMPGTTPKPLQVKDKHYSKGLGTHATSEIIVLLDGRYTRFESQVGVQFQEGGAGSVVFQVYVDDAKKYDSGVLRQGSDAKEVTVSLAGASVMKLVVNDGGDGVTCDAGNWLDPVLTLDPSAATRPVHYPDMALFARLITCDPERMDGVRTGRLQKFNEEDLQLDTDVLPAEDGTFTVPVYPDGRGVIGLRWLERRRITKLGIEFADGTGIPATDGVAVQVWFMSAKGGSPGGSAWQGHWEPLKGNIERMDHQWIFHLDWLANSFPPKGIMKVRWVFPKLAEPVVVKRLIAITASKSSQAELVLHMDGALPGQTGDIEMYNGTIVTPQGDVTRYRWDFGAPLHLEVRYCESRYLKTDRTVLRLKLPAGRFGVAVDDILANPCVYVPDFGIFATSYPAKISLEEYKRQIADKKTLLQQVRQRSDQTLSRAMKALHPGSADLGPTLVSLACSNRKYIVSRDGSISFEQSPEVNNLVDHQLVRNYYCSVNLRYGSGAIDSTERHLQGGWLPIPVTTVRQGGVIYQQRSYVAPYGKDSCPGRPVWMNDKPLFVAEITVTNPLDRDADASVSLDFIANVTNGKKMAVTVTDYGAMAEEPEMALVSVNTQDAGPLQSGVKDGGLTLRGKLPANSSARCYIHIPGWEIDKAELTALKTDEALVKVTENYWNEVMGQAAQIDVPDSLLKNLILASQVHCFLAARNANGRIAPWIGAFHYGPLDSEAQSVIRGMAFMGQEDFARRSLDYFISRYNQAGYLEPTYTLMGTGWNLWNIGEFHGLYNDVDWMRRNAPEVARVCDWISRQRAKTMKLDVRGERLPEYGLNPPGAMADWEVFSYYFYSNGYFYAGLNEAAKALASIGYPGAEKLIDNAADYRKQIERAFHYVQAQAPVFPLKNGTWVPEYPTQLYCPAPTDHFYRGEDFGRSWAYDVELGAHHLVPQGVLDPNSKDVEWMMDHMEDVQFLCDGWFAYPKVENEKNPYDFGGFAKVQPYYARNAEVYAMRDDVKPFIRSYFNTIPTLLNLEDLSLWEHFNANGAWNKTHETGYFLYQSRIMLVQERGNSLWLAPFVTNNWLKEGMSVSVVGAPTRFGKVSYRIDSHVDSGYIEATIEPPARAMPAEIVIRLRHPEGTLIKAVIVNGQPHVGFNEKLDYVRIVPDGVATINVRAEYIE